MKFKKNIINILQSQGSLSEFNQKIVDDDFTNDIYGFHNIITNKIDKIVDCIFTMDATTKLYWSIDRKKTIKSCIESDEKTQICKVEIRPNQEVELFIWTDEKNEITLKTIRNIVRVVDKLETLFLTDPENDSFEEIFGFRKRFHFDNYRFLLIKHLCSLEVDDFIKEMIDKIIKHAKVERVVESDRDVGASRPEIDVSLPRIQEFEDAPDVFLVGDLRVVGLGNQRVQHRLILIRDHDPAGDGVAGEYRAVCGLGCRNRFYVFEGRQQFVRVLLAFERDLLNRHVKARRRFHDLGEFGELVGRANDLVWADEVNDGASPVVFQSFEEFDVFNRIWNVTETFDRVRVNRDESDVPGGLRCWPHAHSGVVQNRFDIIEMKLRNEESDPERKSNSQENWIGSFQIHVAGLDPDWNATTGRANLWLLLAIRLIRTCRRLCFDFLNVLHGVRSF